MSEKGIVMTGESVRAILAGRKTQTRRVIKPQPALRPVVLDMGTLNDETGKWVYAKPQYRPGDILWVRETWGVGIQMSGGVIYKANYLDACAPLADGEKWRSSRFMPRAAARLFLRVTDVRAERVQEISEADAIAEGRRAGDTYSETSSYATTARQSYMWLWDKINGKSGHGWIKNDWVWVYTFERVDEPC